MQGIIKELLTKNAPKHVHQIEGYVRGWNVAESLVTKFQVSTFNSLFINGEKIDMKRKLLSRQIGETKPLRRARDMSLNVIFNFQVSSSNGLFLGNFLMFSSDPNAGRKDGPGAPRPRPAFSQALGSRATPFSDLKARSAAAAPRPAFLPAVGRHVRPGTLASRPGARP